MTHVACVSFVTHVYSFVFPQVTAVAEGLTAEFTFVSFPTIALCFETGTFGVDSDNERTPFVGVAVSLSIHLLIHYQIPHTLKCLFTMWFEACEHVGLPVMNVGYTMFDNVLLRDSDQIPSTPRCCMIHIRKMFKYWTGLY